MIKEIKSIIDSSYEETKKILLEKRSIVEGLAKRLIDKLTVDGPDFEKLYNADGNLAEVFSDCAVGDTVIPEEA